MDELDKIVSRYKQLNIDLSDAINEEKKISEFCRELSFEYKMCNDDYQFDCEQIKRFNERFENRRSSYANNKCCKHVGIAGLIAFLSLLCLVIIGVNFGMITNLFSSILGSVAFGALVSMFDMCIFWDKVRNKALNCFDDLESTKRSRDVSDKLYIKKLKSEKELINVKGKLDFNNKLLNIAKGKIRSLEKQIINLKIQTFDNLVDVESKDDDMTLTLK